MAIDRGTAELAARDAGVFAEVLVGEPLWDHQLEVVRSRARTRCICSGRQAGKSRTLAVLALFEGFTNPGSVVLLLSATDDAAKDLLLTISNLASGPLLAGSVVDDTKSQITLSNGSVIRSIPASMRQARGKSVDLLVLDEACFVEEEVWGAARYTILATGGRVVMASTPWGKRDRFFAVNYEAGRTGTDGFESFHWPSQVSPLVSAAVLEEWRSTTTDREYRSEIEALWVDAAGAYFTPDELDGAVGDYALVPPEQADGLEAVAGVDWAFAHDANALVLLTQDPNDQVFWIPWILELFNTPYSAFIDEIATVGRPNAYKLTALVSEMNGVGAAPTQELESRRVGRVQGIHTDARSKENAFGMIKMLLQQSRLSLPRHPALLRQLAALEYETRDTGTVHIAVPERLGHDDIAMALSFAIQGEPSLSGRRTRKLKFRGPHNDFGRKPPEPERAHSPREQAQAARDRAFEQLAGPNPQWRNL